MTTSEPPDDAALDERASALLDAFLADGATSDDPAIASRVAAMATARRVLRDVRPPSPEVREQLIATALAGVPALARRGTVTRFHRHRRAFTIGGGALAAAAAVLAVVLISRGSTGGTIASSRGALPVTAAGAGSTVLAGAETTVAAPSSAHGATGATAATAANKDQTRAPQAGGSTTAAASATTVAFSARPALSSAADVRAEYSRHSSTSTPEGATAAPTAPSCRPAGTYVEPVLYQGVEADMWVSFDATGHHVQVIRPRDCQTLIVVDVP